MDVVYLYNGNLGLRAPIVTGVSELIHSEGDYTLQATIPAKYKARPGEYIGFRCIDGRFRLFLIDLADDVEDDGTTEITATDAAVAELADSVAENVTLGGETADTDAEDNADGATENVTPTGKTAEQAARDILTGTGFKLGTVTAGSETGTGEYAYIKRWTALKRLEEDLNVRIVPYYTIEGARITEKRVDVLAKTREYRGRFFERGRDATGIVVSYSGAPKTVLYGVGAVSGESETERVTIGGAAWSRAQGNPADKPEGQTYVEDAEAIAIWGRHEDVYEDKEETDPNKLMTKTWAELQKHKQPEVSAQATIRDMEYIRGHEHKAVRMWDWVLIETRKAGNVGAQVINIKRDYIHPNRTKLTIGQEGGAGSSRAGLVSQIAALRRETSTIGARGAANKNRSIYSKHLIQLNANAIQLNAETIMAQAEAIALKANKEDVDGRFKEVSLTLDAYKNTLEAHAGILDEHGNLIEGVRTTLDGQNQTITNMAGKLDEQGKLIEGVQTTLDGQNQTITNIAGKVDKNTGALEGVQEKISGQDKTFEVMAGKISKQGELIDGVSLRMDGIEKKIELKADKITLDGYVTASQFQSEVARVNSFFSGVSVINTINATSATIGTLQVGNYTMGWQKMTVVNSFTQASGETAAADQTVIGVAVTAADPATYTPEAGTTVTFRRKTR